MKTYIITGLISAASLLATTNVFGADCLTGGVVTDIGSGIVDYIDNNIGNNGTDYSMRWVKITCNGNSGTYFFHSSTDPNGKFALAMMAMSENRTVSYKLYDNNPAIAGLYIVEFKLEGN